MGFGFLRSIIRPLSRTLISRTPTSTSSTTPFFSSSSLLKPDFQLLSTRQSPWIPISNHFHSLTDTRFAKRRPVDKPRRKRASLRPPGTYSLKLSIYIWFNLRFCNCSKKKIDLQGLMLGFSTRQGSRLVLIIPIKGASKEEMRKSEGGSGALLFWCVIWQLIIFFFGTC